MDYLQLSLCNHTCRVYLLDPKEVSHIPEDELEQILSFLLIDGINTKDTIKIRRKVFVIEDLSILNEARLSIYLKLKRIK